ncbi:hypothetical protein OY671_008287, partial [Metschnikowia pulcherrima]
SAGHARDLQRAHAEVLDGSQQAEVHRRFHDDGVARPCRRPQGDSHGLGGALGDQQIVRAGVDAARGQVRPQFGLEGRQAGARRIGAQRQRSSAQSASSISCAWSAVRSAIRPSTQSAGAADAMSPDRRSPRSAEDGPAEVAQAILFSASDSSSYSTGIVVDVNGGFHIH